MFKEHDRFALTKRLPEENLEVSDMGAVVLIHKGGAAYEMEFMTLTGETAAIVTLAAGHFRTFNRRDVAHTRELQAA